VSGTEGRAGLAGVVVPEASYLICATPRSGSTLLCDALEGTGIAGRPAEHFEVLLETGLPRQPRDYFQRSNDPEVWVPGAKATLYDRGIGVMLILRGPGGFSGGRAVDALVSHIDLFPTVCDLVGAQRPPWLQGESLLPLMNGEVDEVRDTLFAEKTYHVAYEPERCARTLRWKYIRRFDEEHPTPVLANIDDGPSKEVVLSNGWAQRHVPAEQLYDLLHDPNEANNLAGEPALESVLDDMRARLTTWMHETEDPLLDGPVPAPMGAELNSPDQLSPADPTITA
jgi:N-sulfoglucosamine sulfohydrolase